MKDISYRVALGGIVAALCLICMFLAGIMPALYIILPMIAGVLLMIIVTEVSVGWAALTYIAVGMLSMIICADKEAALLFIIVFGHYPILRFYIQAVRSKPLRILIKLVLFNISLVVYYWITVTLLGLQTGEDSLGDLGKAGLILALFVCNFILICHDFNLGHIHTYYVRKLRPYFRRKR